MQTLCMIVRAPMHRDPAYLWIAKANTDHGDPGSMTLKRWSNAWALTQLQH